MQVSTSGTAAAHYYPAIYWYTMMKIPPASDFGGTTDIPKNITQETWRHRMNNTDCIGCHQKDDRHENTLGRDCGACHGERDWKSTKGKFDHDKTQFPLRNGHAGPKVECKACHKSLKEMRKTPLDCLSCHRKDDKHKESLGRDCGACHTARNALGASEGPALAGGRLDALGWHAPSLLDERDPHAVIFDDHGARWRDRLFPTELLDRARERLEVGVLDDEELALRHLEPADDLVLGDFAVVRGAPALLPDRRPALAMERAEADVRLLRLRSRREGQADRDVDQAEGN